MHSDGLKLDGICKDYAGLRVFNSLSLQFNPGEISLLIGANGSGKSTLLRIAIGLLTPDSGTVHRSSAAVGYVGHLNSLYMQLSVAENLDFWSSILPEAENIETLLMRWGLTKYRNRRVAGLSKGIQTRVGLARALCASQKTILLDEPTASLDDTSVGGLITALQEKAQSGAVVVIASHDLARLLPIATRVVLLRDGIVASDAQCGNHTELDALLTQYQGNNR